MKKKTTKLSNESYNSSLDELFSIEKVLRNSMIVFIIFVFSLLAEMYIKHKEREKEKEKTNINLPSKQASFEVGDVCFFAHKAGDYRKG
ncbi:MAG: hypothetical protein LBT27_05835 [Prevotellaceae bacterium]|jgi:hypothetical protein|nr:hypothetical protein [Prevotellaceae bacterium]